MAEKYINKIIIMTGKKTQQTGGFSMKTFFKYDATALKKNNASSAFQKATENRLSRCNSRESSLQVLHDDVEISRVAN
jgi:hypothetical protein